MGGGFEGLALGKKRLNDWGQGLETVVLSLYKCSENLALEGLSTRRSGIRDEVV